MKYRIILNGLISNHKNIWSGSSPPNGPFLHLICVVKCIPHFTFHLLNTFLYTPIIIIYFFIFIHTFHYLIPLIFENQNIQSQINLLKNVIV